jgi:hypothetical protein
MADNLSDVLEADILKYYFASGVIAGSSTVMTRPGAWFVSLHTSVAATETTAAWLATEITASSGASNYTRATIVASSISTGAGASTGSVGVAFSSATFLQATAAGGWGTISALGIWDAQSNGGTQNLLFWISLAAGVPVAQNDTVQIGNGAITLYMS